MNKALKITLNSLVGLLGAMTVIASYSYANVGSDNDISLQSTFSSITAADFAAVRDGTINDDFLSNTNSEEIIVQEYVQPVFVQPVKDDVLSIEKNTYIVSSDETNPYEELMDPSTFTYDGRNVWVDVSTANMRSNPGVDNDSVCQVEKGDVLVRISFGSNWSYVRNEDGDEGYILTSLLSEEEVIVEEITPTPTPTPTATPVPVATATPAPAQTQQKQQSFSESDYSATLYASCSLNVRTGPGTTYEMVRVLSTGAAISVVAQTNNGWYKTSDGYYVKSDLCTSTEPAPITPPSSESGSDSSSYSDFASYCLQFVGTPYVYAASSPSGFDCSGLVMYVYANYYGISLPHSAASIATMGTPVSSDNIQCGDVMCHDYNGDGYIDHVSIYLGNGTCIHASDSRHGVITSSYPMNCVTTIRRFI